MSIGTPLLSSLDQRIEAALLAIGRPVTLAELSAALPHGADVEAALGRIAEFWRGRGIQLSREGDGWVMRARTEILSKDTVISSRRLSPAAIATLAVIALHQPITISQIEKVRGLKVNQAIISSLKLAGLIIEGARSRRTGAAISYLVTEQFLESFDVDSLADLPTAEEVMLMDLDISDDDAAATA